jgi:TonB family protein
LGAVVSLVVHTALVLPFVLPSRAGEETVEERIDQLAVFLVPPDAEGGRASAAAGLQWSGIEGDGGAVEDPTPIRTGEPVLRAGPAGEPEIAPEPLGDPAPEQTETALTEIEVDSMVERDPTSAAPMYPAEMLEKSIEGATFVHYVVDTTGRVDTLTIRVIRSTHAAFTRSVREALGLMRFRPAVQGAQRVRQWVQQNFAFKILQRAPPADTT